jgi:hypothetical protein
MSELEHKNIESLFQSELFMFCMSFIRSNLPRGEKSPKELLVGTSELNILYFTKDMEFTGMNQAQHYPFGRPTVCSIQS